MKKRIVAAICMISALSLYALSRKPQEEHQTTAAATDKVPVKSVIRTDMIPKEKPPIQTPAKAKDTAQATESQSAVFDETVIQEQMQTDKALAKIMDVQNVTCNKQECKILVEATGEDRSELAMGIASWMQEHPEYGTTYATDTDSKAVDNPKAMLLILKIPEE